MFSRKKRIWIIFMAAVWSISTPTLSLAWGFFTHKQINRHAVFTLPAKMLVFYKHNLTYITDHAVTPDNRRYVVEGEAQKHYIDIEYYREQNKGNLPFTWSQAKKIYSYEQLKRHGVLPWNIMRVKLDLQHAFESMDTEKILRLSADIGHYIGDANVPFHTTVNYDGQLTGQQGIHGLWETQLPELFFNEYNLWVGAATYIHHPQKYIWDSVLSAHDEYSKALVLEKQLSDLYVTTEKYSFEKKGNILHKVYSRAYAKAYHDALKGQVERQVRKAIKMTGDFWLTCWMDAGSPDLGQLKK